jgi:hypothetical protein
MFSKRKAMDEKGELGKAGNTNFVNTTGTVLAHSNQPTM